MKKGFGNQGFILAEVIVGILIIGVALVPIVGMFVQAIHGDAMAREYTIVSNLGQKQLELLKIHSPTYWAGLSLPCVIPWQDETQLPAPKYSFTTRASAVTNNLVQVSVTAVWKERGIDCIVQFVTFYPTL